MDYRDIIRQNVHRGICPSWWCKYAFHFTDVCNAASILGSGKLHSRSRALSNRLMRNDNASRQVIDITDREVISNVRLYFRPQTPTQYYNEGYKHPALRYHGDANANVPVPVFFLFDLEKLLTHSGVEFSERSQAGHRARTFKTIEEFSRLNFEYIYDNTYKNLLKTKNYRHAEILIPDSLDIDQYLSYVLCRNSIEQMTLLNLLEKESADALERYKYRIKVYKKDVFYDNGIHISGCESRQGTIYVTLSDSHPSVLYNERAKRKRGLAALSPIDVCLEVEWIADSGRTLKKAPTVFRADIETKRELFVSSLPVVPGATKLGIRIFFEGKLMCYLIRSLASSELLE